MIDESFINKVVELSKANTFKINGVDFSDKQLHEIKKPATPDPEVLIIHTLSGLIDYIKNKLDNENELTIHIENYNSVGIMGKYEPEYGRRKRYLNSICTDFLFQFNKFYQHEEFIINLQTQFKHDDAFKDFIKIIGNIQSEATAQTKDDGCSQQTTIKSGIVTLDQITLPNPVTLTPMRTFPEIEQPSTQFILRMRRGTNGVELALFEASGGFWRVDCIHKIRDYLKEQLKDIDVKHTVIA